MFSFLKNLVYKADLLKTSFIPLFKTQKLSSTYFGSIFSLFILAVVVYLFATSNMVNKINPYVIDQVLTTPHASLITWTPQNFELAIGLCDYMGKGYTDPTMFKIDIIQYQVSFNSTSNKMYISYIDFKETTQCTPENFSDPETFQNFGFNNYTCLKNSSDSLEIEGGFDEQSLKAVAIMVTFCNNSTNNNTCKSQAQINQFLSGKGLWAYFQDTVYDVSNYENPLAKTWKLKIAFIATVSRLTNIIFKKLSFLNDANFLYSSFDVSEGWIRESMEITNSWIKPGFAGTSHAFMINETITAIIFSSSKNLQNCQREYEKLGTLIAEIGGIINVLIIIGRVLCSILNKYKMQRLIIDNLYCFSSRRKNADKEMKNLNKNIDHSKDLPANFRGDNEMLKSEIYQKPTDKSHQMDLVPLTLINNPKINIFGSMKLKLKKARRGNLTLDEKLTLIAEKNFINDTDVLNLIRTLNKFEILKKIVFSKEQLDLFHLCAKPLIYVESQKEKVEHLQSFKMTNSLMNISGCSNQTTKLEDKMQNLRKFHKELANKPELSIIERNILEIMEKY